MPSSRVSSWPGDWTYLVALAHLNWKLKSKGIQLRWSIGVSFPWYRAVYLSHTKAHSILPFPSADPQQVECLTWLSFRCSVLSNSLWPHELQHARLPCPSPSLWVCSESCLLSQWFYLTISSSAALFSFCIQFFPASVFFNVLALPGKMTQTFMLVGSESLSYCSFGLVLLSKRVQRFVSVKLLGSRHNLLCLSMWQQLDFPSGK